MPVDKFGRTRSTSKKITNVSGVLLGYVNNVLRKGQAIDMNKKIFKLGSGGGPNSAVRKKYLNEKFLRKDEGTMQGHLIWENLNN